MGHFGGSKYGQPTFRKSSSRDCLCTDLSALSTGCDFRCAVKVTKGALKAAALRNRSASTNLCAAKIAQQFPNQVYPPFFPVRMDADSVLAVRVVFSPRKIAAAASNFIFFETRSVSSFTLHFSLLTFSKGSGCVEKGTMPCIVPYNDIYAIVGTG